jgi:predicted pyridoxine 5'-phosphate oxidase superfamily flavin-nucleotide-binding protein
MYRDPILKQIVLTNGHAPDMFRAVTVRNLDAWYPAFDVKQGQKLYLPPEKRVKIWGEARVVEDDPALTDALMPKDYRARPEQVILFRITAWDTNCPQHIPQKFDAADVAAALASRDARIAELEAELAALKGQPGSAQ